MVAFWAEMGVAYLEINKLPCLHEIDISKCINAGVSKWAGTRYFYPPEIVHSTGRNY